MSETPSYQRFFAELKRRRVFRVAAVYGATAFVVVQVADVLQEALHLPEAFLTGVTVAALLGFPLAVALAWAYDRTPQGVVRTEAATTQEIQQIVSQPASRRWPSGLLALVGVAALAAAAWLTLGRGAAGGATAADDRGTANASAASGAPTRASIAVLPFANLSGDEETQPFADGLQDDLLTQLAKIGALTVISRTSVQEYRNTTKNVRQIASELGVATVLEGGVQRAGDRYRINVQLIDAASDAHLWADQYSGELTTANIFDVQTDIATSIAGALQANLTAGERESLERLPTESLEAYQSYQQARELRRGYSEVDLRAADRLVSQAVEADSDFVEAWALKAVIASEIYWFYYDRSDSIVNAADEVSRRALELAPGLAEGHWARGHYYYRTQLDYDRAMAEVETALEERPGEADFISLSGDILRRQGNTREALARYERVAELAPRDPNAQHAVCGTRTLLRQFEAAAVSCERAVELQPDYFIAYRTLAEDRIGAAGDTAGARRWLTEARNQGGGRAALEDMELYDLEMLERNAEGAIEEAANVTGGVFNNQYRYVPASLAAAFARSLAGDTEGARASFDSARAELQALVDEHPDEPRYRSSLGLALAGLGRNEEAIGEGEEGLRLMPPEKEAWRGAWRLADLARIEAMTGRQEEAIGRLERLLSMPSDLSVWMLRLDPAWDPLRENPRFKALVAE
jgi:TolB-like protein/Tfp pilus assembly protein PilF